MPSFIETVAARLAMARDRIFVGVGGQAFGPLLIDRGRGMLYDVERNITWLQDANYAQTVARSTDGQLNWYDAKAWVASLNYRGITGWRLPDARAADGSGPGQGDSFPDGEIGHLFLVAALRRSPANLELTNFESFSIYWYRNEASIADAYAFKLVGLKQGLLSKDPWSGPLAVPLTDKVLAWPVHDGDVGPRLFSRLLARLTAGLFSRVTRR